MPRQARSIVEYRVYELPLHFPIILLHGDEWRISDVLSNRLHFHNCYEIGLCHSDGGILAFGEEVISFQAGDVTCIPRHIPHTTCSDEGTQSLWSYLFIDFDQLLKLNMIRQEAAVKRQPLDRYWVFGEKEQQRIHFLATCIVEEMLAKRPDCETVTRQMLALLYYELLRLERAQERGGGSKWEHTFQLKPALEHIAHSFMQPMTVEDLARRCNLSQTHFRRLFVSVVGESPCSFLNITRINEACALLITTQESILSIAEAVGFASISSFNRYFMQVVGVSPKQYRNPSVRETLQPKRKYVVRYHGWMKPEVPAEPVR